MNTLLFQVIPQQTTITTYSAPPKKGKYLKQPNNAKKGSWQRTHIYQVGRDEQMVGNKNPKSAKPPYPICPYHMPTNSDRYNDPSLHVPYKKVKDLIELKDINRLIERNRARAFALTLSRLFSLLFCRVTRQPCAELVGRGCACGDYNCFPP